MSAPNYEKTLVVWRRLGKEHGEGQGFQINSNEVIDTHLSTKVEVFRQIPESEWRWWKLAKDIIVEKPVPDVGFTADTLIYYFLEENWAIIENMNFPGLDPKWRWYIHIAEFDYSATYDSWIMTDMFADILVHRDRMAHTVLDLDELADAERLGLITSAQLQLALKSCQDMLDLLRHDDFPPRQISECVDFVKSRMWR